MKTYSAKPAEVDKKWVMIDADGLVVGRLASIVAMRLRGKHKPTLHAACRLRRQRHRHQRRQGGADRPQGRAEGLLPAHRLYRRHQGTHGEVDPDGPLSRAHRREGGRAHAAARPARHAVSSAICGSIRGAEHPHAAQQPEKLDVAAMNRKNKRSA